MTALVRRAALLLLAAAAMPLARTAGAQAPAMRLFKIVTQRDEITIGLSEAELQRLGAGPEVERIARKLAADGQFTSWRYVVGRTPDGSTRHEATGRVAILRSDALRVEPYAPGLPVAPPPAE